MTTALLGVDALYRQESGRRGAGGAEYVRRVARPEAVQPMTAARARLEELAGSTAQALPEPDRRRYYDQLCHSTLAFINWREQGLPLSRQLTDFLHVPAEPASRCELDELRSQYA